MLIIVEYILKNFISIHLPSEVWKTTNIIIQMKLNRSFLFKELIILWLNISI